MASKDYPVMLEVCRVSPFTNSATPPPVEFSLSLSYFDIFWLKFFPVKQIFFYQLSEHESTHTFFNSAVLPKLKHSLSLTLSHFLPVAGNIIWPIDSVKPFIICTPNDDVSLIVVKSNADLTGLIQNEMHDARDLHPYVPELPVSDSKAALISFQITYFPSQGFSIGISVHHAMFDGKSVTMFMKAWTHFCKENVKIKMEEATLLLPLKLTPFFDRTVFTYPPDIDILYLNNLLRSSSDPNPKSLTLLGARTNVDNLVRANFEFSLQDINKLRQKVISILIKDEDVKHMHLSPFVLSIAYTFACMIKAKMEKRKGNIGIIIGGDGRSRLEPSLPVNYFGNCLIGFKLQVDTEAIIDSGGARKEGLGVQLQHLQTPFTGEATSPAMTDSDDQDVNRCLPLIPEEKGIAFLAKKISEKIKGLEITKGKNFGTIEEERKNILEVRKIKETSDMFMTVSWSPKFEIYNGTDFGWGKLKKTQIVTIDNNGAVSITESRNGNGGMEVELVMERHEMEMFKSLFVNGLKTILFSMM